MALTEDGIKKLKLKKLCTTRWSSRIDTVRALKNRYADILKVLMRIILTSKDSKERADATALKKNIDSFNFVVCIIIWERILTSLHRISQKLQATNTDLSASVRLQSVSGSVPFGELKLFKAETDKIVLTLINRTRSS